MYTVCVVHTGDDMDKMFEQIKAGACTPARWPSSHRRHPLTLRCLLPLTLRCLLPCSRAYQTGKYEFRMPQWKNVSEEAKKVVSRMLVVNPDRRATIDELLRDPWLASKHKEGEANLKGKQ